MQVVRRSPVCALGNALLASIALLALNLASPAGGAEPDLRVGAAAVDFAATDDMVIGGGIGPGKVVGQEGKLRAVAVVLKSPSEVKLAIIACDVLMIERDILDASAKAIAAKTGIPFENILINCTHTHHAPTTVTIHGYKREEEFTRQVGEAIVKAAEEANTKAEASAPVSLYFRLGQEATVGQNSRVELADGSIFWIGPRDKFVRPTGPFDPDLPILSFRDAAGKQTALIYNHSTHTIGTRSGKRSPGFYGLAAQELEESMGGTVLFLEGASGSTHNLVLDAPEMILRIKRSIEESSKKAAAMPASILAAKKREIDVKVRSFNEGKEDAAVVDYCKKYAPSHSGPIIENFRYARRELKDKQGTTRKTWVQALRIGDVAFVGVPAEYFTTLGIEIKRQSPFRYTYVAELANDYIGYVPDYDAYDRGGYQVWTGLHSYVERGTGEKIVLNAVELLNELHQAPTR